MAVDTLVSAKKNKTDEYYTQLNDIEQELKHYKDQFQNKVIFCNCDDPFESNFFKFFAMNFNYLGIKKLIATCYGGSPIMGEQLSLFDVAPIKFEIEGGKPAYKIEITKVDDANGDGATDLSDVEYLLKNKKNALTLLNGNGDFRSEECIELLKQADVVVTNPPFSLFREYVSQLVEYEKKFIIIGNKNSINYRDVFRLMAEEKLWLGYRNINDDMWFIVPRDYKYEKIIDGLRLKHIMGCWFTNLDTTKRHEKMKFYKSYSPAEYSKYDNYDAINVDKVANIPGDYYGIMGVPITFLDKYNPEQFEILGLSQKYGYGLESNKRYDKYKEMRQDGTPTGSSGKKTNGNPVMSGKPLKGNYYTDGKDFAYSLYGRIFIKRR